MDWLLQLDCGTRFVHKYLSPFVCRIHNYNIAKKTIELAMFYLIGIGLCDETDITLKGLEIVKKARRVYLEAYTSILTVGKEALEKCYGREVIIADRDLVEHGSDDILADADKEDVALLVIGDPFGATTHTDLVLRAKARQIPFKVVHNASIMNAVGCCGLQLYNFGEAVSIVFWTEEWRPDSFYDKIAANRARGLHTLCLLDIKVKEQSIENLMRGKNIFEPPRFMTVNIAAQQLLEITSKKKAEGMIGLAFADDTLCVGLSKIGSDEQVIKVATMKQMCEEPLGDPLHSLIIPGQMHPVEASFLKLFAANTDAFTILDAVR